MKIFNFYTEDIPHKIFRLFCKRWSNEKILRKLINKQFAIINEKHPKGYKDWYSYLTDKKSDDWFRQYHFKSPAQEEQLMMYYYKIMKLHKNEYYPTDKMIFKSWCWDSLQWFFSLENKEDIGKTKNIADLPHHNKLWYKIFKLFNNGNF